MSTEAFEVEDGKKLTVDELKLQHADPQIICLVNGICGPNGFAVMIAFEKWLKEKGGKP